MNEVCEILNQVMQERGLKIAEVARLCGLADSTVRAIIMRKQKSVALDVAFRLSRGLNVPLEVLNGEQTAENARAQDPRLKDITDCYRDLNEAGKDSLHLQAYMHRATPAYGLKVAAPPAPPQRFAAYGEVPKAFSAQQKSDIALFEQEIAARMRKKEQEEH